jgi:hypothetical protein
MDCPLYQSTKHVKAVLRQLWKQARRDYRASGEPFGPSKRALDIWIMYNNQTTCN